MAKSGRIDVVLTEQGRAAFQNDVPGGLLKDGTHFNCEEAEQVGAMLRMRVVSPFKLDGQEFTRTDLYIPIHFVLYMITAGVLEKPGFKLAE